MSNTTLKLALTWLLVMICLPVAAANFHRTQHISLLSTSEVGDLTLTLTTDKKNYVKGEQIHISGTVSPITCEATLTLSCGEWESRAIIPIDNGTYTYDYIISFGDPEGTWNITLQVWDETVSDNVTVGLPADTVYYTVVISSPPKGHTYMRGTPVHLSANVTEAGAPVENAIVSCRSSKGENLTFTENTPGWYSLDYILGWDEPLGKWSISVEAKKVIDNKLKAGGSYTNVEIEPAVIDLDILNPTKHNFVTGEIVDIEVKASYPTGATPENVIVTATLPDGENIPLTKGENSVYTGTYKITSENITGWIIGITATDSHGNSGNSSFTISIVPPESSPALFLILLVIIISLAVGVTFSFVGLRKRRAERLKSIREEKKDIQKAQRDVAVQYFKKGEISRETYDKLMHELERKLMDLEKEESILKGEKKRKE